MVKYEGVIMKKLLLSFTVLFGFSLLLRAGGTWGSSGPSELSKIRKVGFKRAWKCRNPWWSSSQVIKDRRLKNKCTKQEIVGGDSLSRMIEGLSVGVGAVVATAAFVGARLGPILRDARKVEKKYGDNWENNCNEIINDDEMPKSIKEMCREELLLREGLKKAKEKYGDNWRNNIRSCNKIINDDEMPAGIKEICKRLQVREYKMRTMGYGPL